MRAWRWKLASYLTGSTFTSMEGAWANRKANRLGLQATLQEARKHHEKLPRIQGEGEHLAKALMEAERELKGKYSKEPHRTCISTWISFLRKLMEAEAS